MTLTPLKKTHLKQLEAESTHIIREVAAEFDNPVMLYSVGKDSAVMLHLAMKAFAPGKLPFPLMHIAVICNPVVQIAAFKQPVYCAQFPATFQG